MSTIAERIVHRLDIVVRRQSRFGKLPWLRKLLLRPYRKLINFHGHGVLMNIGGCIPARMPSEYAWKVIDDYEPESVSAMKQWLEAVENPLVVDVGCALGFISCAALFGNPSASVIAIDSDLQSLKAAQQLCSYAPRVAERLSLVWGFVSSEPTQDVDYLAANRSTLRALDQPGITGDPKVVHYTCLDCKEDAAKPIPRHTLGSLIPSTAFLNSPVMIKCDVEGAEILVFNGAKQLLAARRPTLLISVHPWALPANGGTKEGLHSFLSDLGYNIKVIAVDHEEHWWCVAT
jgi:FkbM family methyltransferase